MAASQEGHTDIVKVLISARANVNAKANDWTGTTALRFASRKGHTEIVNILKQAGAR